MEESVIELLYESTGRNFNKTIKQIEKMNRESILFDWGSITYQQCMLLCDGYIRSNVKRDIIPKVLNQMVIQYLRVPYSENEMLQIFIKTPTRMLVLKGDDIDLQDTIQNVKATIQDKIGFPPEQQRLFIPLRGTQLEDGRRLNDYGIHNESTLILKLRQRIKDTTVKST